MISFLKKSLLFFIIFVFSFNLVGPLLESNNSDSINFTNSVYAQNGVLADPTENPADQEEEDKGGDTGSNTPAASQVTGSEPNVTSNYLGCGTFEFGCKILNALATLSFTVGNWLVGMSAWLMDIFLTHSIQSSSYKDAGFIQQGWEILRDITNIIFIFALVYIAFGMVLGTSSDAKKRLIKVLLVALTINFSLFVTYAIIDVSNVLAHTFYNKIEQKDVAFQTVDYKDKVSDENLQDVKGTSASLGIAEKINPQQILTNNPQVNFAQKLIIVVMVGAVNAAMIYVFLSVTFLFLGRTLGLWIAAVLSPLAFASVTVPKMENLSYVGFSKWFSSLLQMAFMAPVFIFFLYITVKFMEVKIALPASANSDFVGSILKTIIPTAVVVVLLILAKKVATKMSGDFAGLVAEYAAKGAMAVGGVALGGAALAARGTVGAAASAINKSERFKNIVEKGKYGKYLHKGMKNLSSSTFDFRNTAANKMIASNTGFKLGSGLAVDKGYTQRKQEKVEKRQTEEKAFQTYLDKKETGITDHAENGGGKIRASVVEDRIIKNEYEKSKKETKVKDARQELTDAANRLKNLPPTATTLQITTAQTDVSNAQTKLDSEKAELTTFVDNIKADKELLSAGTKKAIDAIDGTEFEVAGRTERYVARRQGNNYNRADEFGAKEVVENRVGAAYGAGRNTGIIGAAIGTAIAPGLGTAIGGALGAALHVAIGKIPGYNETMSSARNWIGDDFDGREADRELSRARYKQETKDNKSK